MIFLENKIREVFPYLFEKWGFDFVTLDDDYGGNIVVAQSDKLRMRFIQDRADFFLDIGRVDEPDGGIGFYEIIDRLKAQGRIHTGYKYNNKMGPVSRLLEQYFSEVLKFFSE